MSSQLLKRLAGPALTLGGLLWITVYIVIVILGLETGKLAVSLAGQRCMRTRCRAGWPGSFSL